MRTNSCFLFFDVDNYYDIPITVSNIVLSSFLDTMINLMFAVCLVAICLVSVQSGDIDDLIKEVFDSSPSPVTPSSQNKVHDRNCTCVPYYLCSHSTDALDDEGIIDIRYDFNTIKEMSFIINFLICRNVEFSCPSYIEVCCEPQDLIKPKTKTGCGHRGGVGTRPTKDDKKAQFGEFPWMVAILEKKNIDSQILNVYQCGGTLIHPEVVLTSAECLDPKKTYRIRAGEWDTTTNQELFPHQDRELKSIVIHPNYKGNKLENNVALLFLESPVTFAENINVVCLPPKDQNSDNSKCVSTGWGKDAPGKKGKYQVIMKKIDLPVVPLDSCNKKVQSLNVTKLDGSVICAGGNDGQFICKGDEGGPLVCPIDGKEERYYQAGIATVNSCDNKIPSVFVRLAGFRVWIDEQMKIKNLNIDSYQY